MVKTIFLRSVNSEEEDVSCDLWPRLEQFSELVDCFLSIYGGLIHENCDLNVEDESVYNTGCICKIVS